MIERFIQMLRGSKERIPDDVETAFSSLVLLVNGEIPASKQFLQGAIEHVFDVTLDIDKDDCEEFIAGQFPIFIYQMNGRLVQLKFMPESYFSEKSAKIAPANPVFVRTRIDTKPIRTAVSNHVMWVEASAMNWDSNIPESEAYAEVGRFLSAFSELAGEAIIWPRKSQIRVWHPSMQELLEAGTPLDIFSNPCQFRRTM